MLHPVNSRYFHTASNVTGKSHVLDNPHCLPLAQKCCQPARGTPDHSYVLQHHLVTVEFLGQVRGTIAAHRL